MVVSTKLNFVVTLTLITQPLLVETNIMTIDNMTNVIIEIKGNILISKSTMTKVNILINEIKVITVISMTTEKKKSLKKPLTIIINMTFTFTTIMTRVLPTQGRNSQRIIIKPPQKASRVKSKRFRKALSRSLEMQKRVMSYIAKQSKRKEVKSSINTMTVDRSTGGNCTTKDSLS